MQRAAEQQSEAASPVTTHMAATAGMLAARSTLSAGAHLEQLPRVEAALLLQGLEHNVLWPQRLVGERALYQQLSQVLRLHMLAM